MKITIEYNSVWQNSFLEPEIKGSQKNRRKFTATSKQKKRVSAPITRNTVLGILCRLMGDQRKLYDIQNSEDYVFKNIEEQVTFTINNRKNNTFTETAFIINKSDKRCAQSTFIGVLPDDTPLFFSETASQLWSVLYLSLDKVMHFILSNEVNKTDQNDQQNLNYSSPKRLLSRINEITDKKSEFGKPIKSIKRMIEEIEIIRDKVEKRYLDQKEKFENIEKPTKAKINTFKKQREKYDENKQDLNDKASALQTSDAVAFDATLKKCITKLKEQFPDQVYFDDGVVYPIRLYASALYIQAYRMNDLGMDISYCLKKNEDIVIQGFSKISKPNSGFNGTRDFLNKLAGGKTKTVGTPYQLTKSDGILDIEIDVDNSTSKKIYNCIVNAGVSSFYLGKKGLAYVSRIQP